MEKPDKRLLILLTNNFAIINLVHTGFLKKLAREYQITIWSDLLGLAEIEVISAHFGIQLNCIEAPVPLEKRGLKWLRLFQKVLFMIAFNIKTQQIKLLEREKSIRYLSILMAKWLLPGVFIKLLLIVARYLIIWFSGRNLPFQIENPDGVIVTSPMDARETRIANYLSRKGTKTMGIVISWDNITSKGIFNARFDFLLVWNELMAAEFNRFYKIFGDHTRVRMTGIVRFDNYFRISGLNGKPDSAKPAKQVRTILFAASAMRHFPDQAEVIANLVEYCNHNADLKLILRPHPNDSPETYLRFAGEKNVFIESYDLLTSNVNARIPALDFLDNLANTLNNCDVCVQVASTFRLDAAACNKPVISIAYDGKRVLPYTKSVKRLYDFSHQLSVNLLGIDHRVESKLELFQALDQLLFENRESRDLRHLVSSHMYCTQPIAAALMLSHIREWQN